MDILFDGKTYTVEGSALISDTKAIIPTGNGSLVVVEKAEDGTWAVPPPPAPPEPPAP
jgi:hypothetical protein